MGDVMVDVTVEAPALAPGGDVHGRVRVRPGGTSANAAVWAAWADADAAVVGAIGQDLAGEVLAGSLEARGVDTAGLVRAPAPTGAMLVVTEAGDRSMVADRGANAELRPADLPTELRAAAVLVSGYLLLGRGTTETAVAVLERAEAPFVAVEAASWPLVEAFGPDRFFEATAVATVLLANAREARSLTGLGEIEACRALGERYRVAAVKRGAAGALLSVDGELLETRAEPIARVDDPTGAGDAFDGVLLAALARREPAREALRLACHAGALVAASAGTWPADTP